MSEWFAYDWELRGVPAQFHVDLQCAAALQKLTRHTTLLYLTCLTRQAAGSDFSYLERRSLDAVLKKSLRLLGESTLYAGYIDLPGQRRYYFYTDDARLLVPLFEYCGRERRLKLECTKAEEPNRQSYYRLLYPDAAKYQTARNLRYIADMDSRGDDLAAPRRINLHFCFPVIRQPDPFLEEVRQQGFAIGQIDCNTAYELPYSVTLHAVSALDRVQLNALTTKAILAAQQYGGVFDRLDSQFVPKKRLR